MNLNRLNKRIQFIRLSEGQDEYGKPTEEVVKLYSCWASLYTQSVKQNFESVGTVLEGSVTFIIRNNKTYTPKTDDNIRFNGIVYDIVQVNDVSSNYKDYLTVVAKTHESKKRL